MRSGSAPATGSARSTAPTESPAPPTAKTRKPPRAYERALQIGLVREFRLVVPEHEALIWATANGELRTEQTASLLQCMGVLPGVPDLRVVTWGGRSADIELKLDKTVWHDRSYCNPAQRELGDLLRAMGHHVFVCRNANEFWWVVEQFMGIRPKGPPRVQLQITGLINRRPSAGGNAWPGPLDR